MHAREPESFWREKVVAVVILLLVSAGMSKWGNKLSNARGFTISQRGKTAYSLSVKINVLTFLVKNSLMKLSGTSIFENVRKNFP